jgi:ribose 5-phosphate isomerase B
MREAGYSVIDAVLEQNKTDYPDVAAVVASAVLEGKADRGVLLCGTGIGISIAANRFIGIRAALCHDEYTARLSRQHNDANVFVVGGRTTGAETAKAMLDVWLTTEFEGGRHIPRLKKIEDNIR